jgi:Predicted DNA alkylation repair enzyme
MKIHENLLELARGNEEYAKFNLKIVNTRKKVLGVRTPDMRKLAKKLASNMSFDDVKNYINECNKNIYEQVLLAGFLINYTDLNDNEKIKLTREYLRYVDSWALVDCAVERLGKKQDKKAWWDFSLKCLSSKAEFTVRYGVIFMMTNYLEDNYIENVFVELLKVKHEGYYVKMGMAWLYATAAVKYYRQTLNEMNSNNLDLWTRKKSLTKMIESYRFAPKQKDEIRKIRSSI